MFSKVKNWFTGAQRLVVDGGSGGPDVSILTLARFGFLLQYFYLHSLWTDCPAEGKILSPREWLVCWYQYTPSVRVVQFHVVYSAGFLQIIQFSIVYYVCATTEPLQSSS